MVERSVQYLFESDPGDAWLIEDVAKAIWDDEPTRSQLVSTRRAAKNVAERLGWAQFRFRFTGRQGGPAAYYDPYDVMSYAMARLKVDTYSGERNPEGYERLRSTLSQGGRNRHLIEPGGAWWRQTQIAIAERDGDAERVAELQAEGERAIAEITAQIKGAVQ